MAYKLQQYSYDWIRDGVTKFLKNDTYSLKPERVLWPMILACTVLNSWSNCIVNVPLRSPEPTWVLTSVVDFYKTMIADRWPTK